MKILKDKYPKGTFRYQKSAGRYIDGFLYKNLEVLADRIVDDMTFLGIGFSSTLEVGTGKSVLFTQIGEAWTDIMNRKHGTELTFTQKNLVFRPEDLIERSFQLPRYSCILLDEWEDAHYWSKLGMTLRKFFRKCRQLNLFILVIIPNYFQLPLAYAVSRSAFAIDVKFETGFQRGFFDFYGFPAKRKLFIKGRKEHNYSVVRADFNGRFLDGYGIEEKEYRRVKYLDMLKYDEEEKKPKDERTIKVELFKQLREKIPEITQKKLAEGFCVSERTATTWMNKENGGVSLEIKPEEAAWNNYIKVQDKDIDYSMEDQLNNEKKD